MCVDDKFSKLLKSYLSEDAVYNFINNMVKESKYCSYVRNEQFDKELVMTKKHNEYFKKSTKCGTCDNDYTDIDVKVRDYCYVTGKHRGSAQRDCNIKVKLNHKISVVCHNLKNYDSHLVMQELEKFHFKTNVIPNVLGKHMNFKINKK